MISKSKLSILLCSIIFFLTLSCQAASSSSNQIPIKIIVDAKEIEGTSWSGELISDFLSRQQIKINDFDRTEPPLTSVIEKPITILVIRVEESYILEDEEIPFREQIVQNESLGDSESYLLQQGKNGIRQITYRSIKENGIEKSLTVFSETILLEPIPEIVMVGITKPFQSVPISGKLAYIVAGNAWMMEINTSSRKPITQSGDLDGRILSISPDGKWLLFSRQINSDEGKINSLYIASLETDSVSILELGVYNVIHHAEWVPGKINTITYSTVEPRDSAPGWQANNDLWVLTFSEGGSVWRNENIIDIQGGGEYGWWGTDYYWSPDGNTLAYSRPDQIGYVDFNQHILTPVINQTTYNTRGDWAWESYLGWAPGSNLFLWQQNFSDDLDNGQSFSVNAYTLADKGSYTLFYNTGMFSFPSPAPLTSFGHYYIAYLQALQINQGDTSRYRLVISEQDGSNAHNCFPEDISLGINPQRINWAPSFNQNMQLFLAVIHDGNLWFIDADKCEAIQITSDGLISFVNWR